MKNKSKSLFVSYKKMHASGEFSRLYIYIHSLMTGLCVAFFIGLFSAGPSALAHSIPLLVSAVLFSVSLTLNTVFSIYFLFFKDNRDITFELFNYSKLINYLSTIAVSLPFISFAFLFFHFSKIVGLIFVLSLAISVVSIFFIIKEMIRNSYNASKAKLDIDDISKLEEFERAYELPAYSESELRERSLEFGLLLFIRIKLVNFLGKGSFDKENIELLRDALISSLINICNAKVGDTELNLLMKKAIVYFSEGDLSEIKVKKYINDIVSKIDSIGSVKFIM